MAFPEDGVEYPESQEINRNFKKTQIHAQPKATTSIYDNTNPVRLIGEESCDPELDKIDLRKLNIKNKDKKISLDEDQFVLVGFTQEESIRKTMKDKLSGIEEMIFDMSGNVYRFSKDNEKSDNLFDIYTKLADLLVRIQKIRKEI